MRRYGKLRPEKVLVDYRMSVEWETKNLHLIRDPI